jgi:phage tail-like protein
MRELSDQSLLVRYRFLVAFLVKDFNFIYPADIRFQKVSGLNARTEVRKIHQGGDNNSVYHLPINTSYENLILEKGRTPNIINFSAGIINMFFSDLLGPLKPVDVLITAINIKGIAMSAWLVRDAYPVRWSVSDLDANSNEVIIDTLELAYKNFKSVSI